MGFFKTVKKGIQKEYIKQKLKTSERKRYKSKVRAEEREAYQAEELKQAKLTGTEKARRVGKKAREPKKGFGGIGSMGIGLRPDIGKGASPLGMTSFVGGGTQPTGMSTPNPFGARAVPKQRRKRARRTVRKATRRKY